MRISWGEDMVIGSDSEIRRFWDDYAAVWVDVVRQGHIASRKAGTDRAIIDAIAASQPKSVLDLGCGEGWLVRELAALGISATGIDASESLIAAARDKGGGSFWHMPYQDLSAGLFSARFDVAVANFSLLGEHDAIVLFDRLPALLDESGRFLMQTLHPSMLGNTEHSADVWCVDYLSRLDPRFTEPSLWFFRTVESWQQLLEMRGMRVESVSEVLDPKSGDYLSILLSAKSSKRPESRQKPLNCGTLR
jgi:cyclopropane fatty-acyl-phospholipid synthase-like methyltransferase